MKLSISLSLVFIAHLLTQVEGQWWLRCRKCDRVTALEDCTEYAECVEGEQCFVDEIITDGAAGRGTVLYRAGCRSEEDVDGSFYAIPLHGCLGAAALCTGSSFGRRSEGYYRNKREDIIACSRCCDSGDFCNDHLCGLDFTRSRNALCNSCDGLDGRPQPPEYPEDCAYYRFCQSNEMCFSSTKAISGTEIRHLSTCRDSKACRTLTKYLIMAYQTQSEPVGRDLGNICSVCCGDELCNKYACDSTKRRILDLAESQFLNMTTLKEII